jgi:hypothetical protein
MTVITTRNLENLHRPGGQFGPGTVAVFEEKLVYLAARIGAIGPDVLAVQELGDPAALEDLDARLPGIRHTAPVRASVCPRHPGRDPQQDRDHRSRPGPRSPERTRRA